MIKRWYQKQNGPDLPIPEQNRSIRVSPGRNHPDVPNLSYSGQNQAVALRHELKHTMNPVDCCALRAKLHLFFEYDDHADVNGKYKVRSLYFDNPDNMVLRQKLDGVNNREKFRIRYYNNDPGFIRLEKKSKINGLCGKQATMLTREECEYLIRGDSQWMRESGNPLILELYTKMHYQMLRPGTVVDYEREAYAYRPGNVRITLDSQIQTGLTRKDLFNPDLPVLAACRPDIAILEVKYDEFLPDLVADIVRISNRRQSPFSKYAAARIYG